MNRWVLLLFPWSVMACHQPDLAVTKSPYFELDSLILSEHAADRFHGTVVIGNQDSIIYYKAVGIANRVWNIPMQIDSRFDIASLNKSFVAALVLLAVEEEKLRLEDKLVDRLKNYSYRGQFDSSITLHQMLTHSAGLPDYDAVAPELAANNFVKFKRLHFSNAEYVDFISQLSTVAAPGQQFYYSNFAYHLLAIILEDVYHQPFAKILQQKISQPLHLTETFASTSNEALHQRVVEGYQYSDEHWQRNNFIDLTLGRRIFSTAMDLYRWGQAMNDARLLSQESLALMQQNHLANITPDVAYGYGWVVFDGKSRYQMGDLGIDQPYLIHGGATEGYKSMLIDVEKGRYIIAFLSNVGTQTDEMKLANKITHVLTSNIHED